MGSRGWLTGWFALVCARRREGAADGRTLGSGKRRGACNQWVFEGRRRGLLSELPIVGAAVIYTDHQKIVGGRYDGQLHAVHMGLVLDVTKQLTAIEGNTSMSGF